VSLGLDLQRQNKTGRWQTGSCKCRAAEVLNHSSILGVALGFDGKQDPYSPLAVAELPIMAVAHSSGLLSLRSLDSLGISAHDSFLVCPEQLSNAKLSNGPRNRLNLSGAVLPLDRVFARLVCAFVLPIPTRSRRILAQRKQQVPFDFAQGGLSTPQIIALR